jgi:hypothetical protein
MKKYVIKLATAVMFVGALLFTVSVSRQGHISPVGKAVAEQEHYTPIFLLCPDNSGYYTVCGAGSTSCPTITCPN